MRWQSLSRCANGLDRPRGAALKNLACDCVRKSAAGAFAVIEFAQGCFQIIRSKVWPALVREHEFSEGAFPKQKIRETLLSAGADQQIHVRRSAAQNFRQNVAERFGRELGHFVEAASSVKNGFPRGVIDRHAQM